MSLLRKNLYTPRWLFTKRVVEVEANYTLTNIWKYKFNDAIEAKGEEARLHFGVGAQTV